MADRVQRLLIPGSRRLVTRCGAGLLSVTALVIATSAVVITTATTLAGAA